MGRGPLPRNKETLPPNGYDLLREFDAVFVGALGDPRVPDNRHARDILLGTRFELDLYVNYGPSACSASASVRSRAAARGHQLRRVPREHRRTLCRRRRALQGRHEDEVAIQEELNTYKGVHRIVRHAFEFAKVRGGEGLHGRQKQRDDRRPRVVAASLS